MFSLVKRKNDSIFPKTPFAFDSLFKDIEKDFFSKSWLDELGYADNTPRQNLRKGEKEDILELSVPGMRREDLNVSIGENGISISGETKERDKSSFAYLKFNKSFALGGNYDMEKIKAELKDGILSIKMPLNEKRKTPKIIDIK